jgi:hypothetical protein
LLSSVSKKTKDFSKSLVFLLTQITNISDKQTYCRITKYQVSDAIRIPFIIITIFD